MPSQDFYWSYEQLKELFPGGWPDPMEIPLVGYVIDHYGQSSPEVQITCVHPIPALPGNIIVTGFALTTVSTWNKHPDPSIDTIDIYRSTTDDVSTAVLRDRVAGSDTSYTDTVPAEGTYYYWFIAVNVFEKHSGFSASYSATTAGISLDDLGTLMLFNPTDSLSTVNTTLSLMWDGDIDTVVQNYSASDWLKIDFPTTRYVNSLSLYCTSGDTVDCYFEVRDSLLRTWYFGANSDSDHSVAGTTGGNILKRYATAAEASDAYVALSSGDASSPYQFAYKLGNTAVAASRVEFPITARYMTIHFKSSHSISEFIPGIYVAAVNFYGSRFYASEGVELWNDKTGSGWKLTGTGITLVNTALTVTGGIGTTHIEDGAITTDKIKAGTIEAGDIGANQITANEIAIGTITGDEIAGTTITGANITTGTITATQITGSTLSAIYADMGTLTAGEIKVGPDSDNYTQINATRTVFANDDSLGTAVRWTNTTLSKSVDLFALTNPSGAAAPALILQTDGDENNTDLSVWSPRVSPSSVDYYTNIGYYDNGSAQQGYLAWHGNSNEFGIRWQSATSDIRIQYPNWSTVVAAFENTNGISIHNGGYRIVTTTVIDSNRLFWPLDSATPGGSDGAFAIDTGNDRIGINVGGTWKWVTVA